MSTAHTLTDRQEEIIRHDLHRIHIVCWVTILFNAGCLACCLMYNMNAIYPRNVGLIYIAVTCIFIHTIMLIVLCNKRAGPVIISTHMRRISGVSGISNVMPAVAVVACAINVSGSRTAITTAMSACMMALFVMIFITQNYCINILKKSVPGFLTLRRLRVHAREHRNRATAAATNGVNEISAVQVLPSYNQATGSYNVTEPQNEGIELPCYEDIYHADEIADGSNSIPPSYDDLNVHNNPRLLDTSINRNANKQSKGK